MLAEQHDERIEGRRYLRLDVLTRARAALTSTDQPADQQTTTTPALTGLNCPRRVTRSNELFHDPGLSRRYRS